jgi:hypothetical protein
MNHPADVIIVIANNYGTSLDQLGNKDFVSNFPSAMSSICLIKWAMLRTSLNQQDDFLTSSEP